MHVLGIFHNFVQKETNLLETKDFCLVSSLTSCGYTEYHNLLQMLRRFSEPVTYDAQIIADNEAWIRQKITIITKSIVPSLTKAQDLIKNRSSTTKLAMHALQKLDRKRCCLFTVEVMNGKFKNVAFVFSKINVQNKGSQKIH